MSSGSPLARVKEEFGGKDKLVDKLVGLVDAGEESKDELRKRLLGAANSKLLRLHVVATKVKAQGGHDKLAAAAAESVGHGKDKDYVTKLESFSNGRLVDILEAGERRAKRKAAASAPGEPARAARPKSAAPKAAAKKKAPAAKSAKAAKKPKK
jgi:hypothetical protein